MLNVDKISIHSSIIQRRIPMRSLPHTMMLSVLTLALCQTVAYAAPQTNKKAPPSVASVLAASQKSDWRPLDPNHTLYMELPQGRVVIELAPEFAPETVANILTYTKEKYYDNTAVIRVQDGYVVQWADPEREDFEGNTIQTERTKSLGSAKTTLPLEAGVPYAANKPFTVLPDGDGYADQAGFVNGFAAARDRGEQKAWLAHCYGTVGVGRDNAADSGNAAELYAVIGHAPRHLDRNVTIVGRVVQGIELLSSLPRGKGPAGFYQTRAEQTPISTVRLASTVPAAQRTNLEVLKTDTDTFSKLIAAKRDIASDWHVHTPHKIELCNVPLPVRAVK
jgi:peptidylprolyl isomerase